MKKLITGLILLMTTLLLTACSKPENTVDPIKVGVIAPLGSIGSSYGEDVVTVYTRAVDAFNDMHPASPVELVVENGNCNGSEATFAINKLINVDEVVAILGGVCSSETITAGKIAQQRQIPMLAPGSSSSEIATIGDYVFRFQDNISLIQTLVDYLPPQVNSALVMAEGKDFPMDLKSTFLKSFQGKVSVIDFAASEADFDLLAAQAKALDKHNTLFVFVQSEETLTPLMQALDKYGVRARYQDNIYGAHIMGSARFLQVIGERADGLLQVDMPGTREGNPRGNEYLQSLQADYDIKSMPYLALQAQDAVSLVLDAISAGHVTPQTIQSFIASFTADNPREGYLGTFWYDERGEPQNMPYVIQRITNQVTEQTQ